MLGRARFFLVTLVLVGGISLVRAPAAHADTYFFSFSGAGATASGIITVDGTSDNSSPNSPPGFDVTGITGTYNNSTIDLIIPDPSACSGGSPPSYCTALATLDPPPDNILYFPGSPSFVDANGLLFSDTNGDLVNLFFDGTDYVAANCPTSSSCTAFFGDPSATITDGTFTVASTPIPPSLPLLATALVGIFLVSRSQTQCKSARTVGLMT